MSLAYRMDNRTLAEFSEDIAHNTLCESIIGQALQLDFTERGHSCQLHETGVDNTGKVIAGNLANCNLDKEYVFADGSSRKIEIVSIPTTCVQYMTFKDWKISKCLEQDAGLIVYRSWDYFFYETAAVQWMAKHLQPRLDYPGFGGKPAVRIQRPDLDKLLDQKAVFQFNWKPKAQKLVHEHAYTLFVKKDKAFKDAS